MIKQGWFQKFPGIWLLWKLTRNLEGSWLLGKSLSLLNFWEGEDKPGILPILTLQLKMFQDNGMNSNAQSLRASTTVRESSSRGLALPLKQQGCVPRLPALRCFLIDILPGRQGPEEVNVWGSIVQEAPTESSHQEEVAMAHTHCRLKTGVFAYRMSGFLILRISFSHHWRIADIFFILQLENKKGS